MALQSALVDRARILRREPSAVRVEGRTQFAETAGEWFRCRLDLRGAAQVTDPGGLPRTVPGPTLLLGIKDLRGDPVLVEHTDRLDVDSRELGRAVYEVNAMPEPLRKKRRVIGYQVAIRRTDEDPFQRP